MRTFLDIQHKIPTYVVTAKVVKEGVSVNVHFETTALNEKLAETGAMLILKGFSENGVSDVKIVRKWKHLQNR